MSAQYTYIQKRKLCEKYKVVGFTRGLNSRLKNSKVKDSNGDIYLNCEVLIYRARSCNVIRYYVSEHNKIGTSKWLPLTEVQRSVIFEIAQLCLLYHDGQR
jgi:hypothetical protein